MWSVIMRILVSFGFTPRQRGHENSASSSAVIAASGAAPFWLPNPPAAGEGAACPPGGGVGRNGAWAFGSGSPPAAGSAFGRLRRLPVGAGSPACGGLEGDAACTGPAIWVCAGAVVVDWEAAFWADPPGDKGPPATCFTGSPAVRRGRSVRPTMASVPFSARILFRNVAIFWSMYAVAANVRVPITPFSNEMRVMTLATLTFWPWNFLV